MRALQWGLLAVGLAGLAWLVARADLALLWEQSRQLGATGILAIVALGGVDQLFHALGWRICFERGGAPGWRALLTAHFAGNAVNLSTPTAGVGGEFVRATLLPAPHRGEIAVTALIVDRLTFAVADAAIGACGVLVLLRTPQLDGWTRAALVGGTSLVILGIAIFALLQRHGRLVALLSERAGVARVLGPKLAARLREAGGETDRRVAAVHAERPASLLASTALHAAGSAMLLAQLACLVGFLGMRVPPLALLQIFAVVTALDLLAVFVPGRLGAQEGARMLGVSLAGLPVELGLLFSLAQRIEQGVWSLVGLGLYTRMLAARPAAQRA